jgi:hypothetical protein
VSIKKNTYASGRTYSLTDEYVFRLKPWEAYDTISLILSDARASSPLDLDNTVGPKISPEVLELIAESTVTDTQEYVVLLLLQRACAHASD